MDPRQYVIESALRHGVDPKIALSVWEQESGGSTDLGLRGQTIQKGKWKGHWARGPWQIMSFHGGIPDSFEGQTDWAMKHLRERGVRGYYGEGTPGVAGHPTTDQYEAQVLGRAGQLPVDVRMASSDSGLPPEMQTPGDPRTGQAQMNGSLPPELGDMPFGAQMYQSLMAEQQAQKPSFGERLAADPFFQMGAAILGAPGRGGNFMAAVGQGMSQGLQAAQAAEAARRETQHNQIRNRLWMEQLNNERFRLLGGEQPTEFEQGQMRYWEGQNATKMRELDLRERGVYASPTESAAPKAPAGYKWTPEGNQTFIPGGPADPAAKASLKGDSGGSKGGRVDADKIDQALSQIDYMEKNLVDPEGGAFQEISSGLGGIGRLAQTAAQGLRNIYNQWLPDPKNPATMTAEVYRRQLSTLAGTLAKANGDTGTLSEGDIKRALDAMPQPDAWPDSRQMAKLLIGNLRQVLTEKKQAASAKAGSLPPETGAAPPSGIPGGWSVEVE